jgi:predicted SAM-dependent methyltransferase
MAQRKLEIGAGDSRLGPDWETSDIRPGVSDYCIAAWDLQFEFAENTFDNLYACMVLEHIPRNKQKSTLACWYYVLKIGGILEIIVPNLKYISSLYGRNDEEAIRLTYGDQGYPEDTHIWGFTMDTLVKALEEVGFKIVELDTSTQLYIKVTK